MITIQVLAEDIKNGIPLTVDKCPIGLAIKRQFPACSDVVIFSYQITIDGKKYYPVNYKQVNQFIQQFDKKQPVYPITLEFTETRNEIIFS